MTEQAILQKILKKLNEHDKRLDKHDGQLANLIEAVTENKIRLDRIEENMATKEDTNRVMTVLDRLVGVYETTDREQSFLNSRVERTEEDIKKIKPLMGLK